MRKLIVLAALAALVSAPAALTKERNIALAGKPSTTKTGQAWTATVRVTRDKQPDSGRAPTIRLINLAVSNTGSNVVNITARATSQVGVYRARVAFPRAGTWRVVVIDSMTGRAYSFGRTTVRAA